MVRLTADNVHQKLGKRVAVGTVDTLDLTDKQIDGVGSFAKFAALSTLILARNRIRYVRELEGLFCVPSLRSLDLRGCPITKLANYRLELLCKIPQLTAIDGVDVNEKEREDAQKFASKEVLSHPLASPAGDEFEGGQPEAKVREEEIFAASRTQPKKVTEPQSPKIVEHDGVPEMDPVPQLMAALTDSPPKAEAPKMRSEPKKESKPVKQPEPVTEPEPKAEPKPKPAAKKAPEPKAEPKPEPKLQAKLVTKTPLDRDEHKVEDEEDLFLDAPKPKAQAKAEEPKKQEKAAESKKQAVSKAEPAPKEAKPQAKPQPKAQPAKAPAKVENDDDEEENIFQDSRSKMKLVGKFKATKPAQQQPVEQAAPEEEPEDVVTRSRTIFAPKATKRGIEEQRELQRALAAADAEEADADLFAEEGDDDLLELLKRKPQQPAKPASAISMKAHVAAAKPAAAKPATKPATKPKQTSVDVDSAAFDIKAYVAAEQARVSGGGLFDD
eukprot:TRINITY_DN5818_c0_g1_i1.p1 TRINITY_DN5818_c0_g1~~TRINITY_DN5818_c0_g1_i1.p1  ORF type:complete len:515 (-),score=189.92 TRINITY_DN5818_c0_g1_i1:54-1547(-)